MHCDELYISFLFPPADYVSGITVFKRIVENNRYVDVLQADFKSDKLLQFNSYVDDYINERIVIDMECKVDWSDCIFKFVKNGINALKNDYKKIYSRSWLMANHFLACEYKFKNPDVVWTAEFSDPLIYDLSNNVKFYNEMMIKNEDYISRLNNKIIDFNNDNNVDLPLIRKNPQAYFVAEYLVYLFADNIIFTNENQREIMLNQFPADIKDFVLSKSLVKSHPTLENKFYHINDVNLNLNSDNINLAYFGNDYYSKRHFESLFYAVESLNHKYKNKIKIFLYLSDDKIIKKLIPSDNFIVKKPLNYLDFLNATTQFDILIVNDVITKGNYEINPYLPSKLSDYSGSGSEIWALYEDGSALSKLDLKYKSEINDYMGCRDELVKILKDYGFVDENYTVDGNYINERFTDLNELYENEFKHNSNLKRQVIKLKKENKELKSSYTFKIKKFLRKVK